jgi:hypothetical protein
MIIKTSVFTCKENNMKTLDKQLWSIVKAHLNKIDKNVNVSYHSKFLSLMQ